MERYGCMINITDKTKCCGCTACADACPKNCITMECDYEGFLYPKVDLDMCVECNVCERVCPQNKEIKETTVLPVTVVARDKRNDVLSIGTSGSIFTSIMEHVLQKNGIVYGVVVDADRVVKHIRVDSFGDCNLTKIPCSKYVRSEIRGIFPKVKQDLQSGRFVCFSGTPCQIAGLKGYLGKDYDNLFTVDVVCHGNPSPLFWRKIAEYLEEKYRSKIIDVRFRNKTYGYHSGTMRVVFENGKVYLASARTNLFLKAFFSDLCSRPSCYNCHFKHIQHVSDLTLYDSWHAAELANLRDDDRGYTNIIVQSKKGNAILERLHTVEKYQVDTKKAIELDGVMVENSVEWNSRRKVFFDGIDTDDIKKHCLRFMKISCKDYFVEWAKQIYYHKKFDR